MRKKTKNKQMKKQVAPLLPVSGNRKLRDLIVRVKVTSKRYFNRKGDGTMVKDFLCADTPVKKFMEIAKLSGVKVVTCKN